MPSVYDRIANPYMPNGIADNTNAPSPAYAPGEVGKAFADQNTGNTYLRVFLDSGATSATTVGAVKANQLAFWKDRANNLVTNDPNFNDTGTPASCVNRVAGIFRTAVTAAPGTNNSLGQPVQYLCDLLIAGKNVPLLATQGATVVPGAAVIADGTTGGSKTVANATTAPTEQILGYSRSSTITGPATAPGTFNADVSIGFIV